MRLAGTAPADIIYSEYVQIGAHYDPSESQPKPGITVVRLPWAYVEELYLGNGLILGSNPWALGGLYLGVVLVDGRFVGLTTLHPFVAHISQCMNIECKVTHDHFKSHTLTMDGYLVNDDTYGHVVRPFHTEVEDTLLEWHQKFRANVEQCRRTATSNGPTHIEIRASSYGPLSQFHSNVVRTEGSINLDFVRAVVADAQVKKHDNCHPWGCEIETFGYGEFFVHKVKRL